MTARQHFQVLPALYNAIVIIIIITIKLASSLSHSIRTVRPWTGTCNCDDLETGLTFSVCSPLKLSTGTCWTRVNILGVLSEHRRLHG